MSTHLFCVFYPKGLGIEELCKKESDAMRPQTIPPLRLESFVHHQPSFPHPAPHLLYGVNVGQTL